MRQLILLRHGQSQWNQENRFTGWSNVPLTELGIQEAHQAGQIIKRSDLTISLIYSSVLERCVETSKIILEELQDPKIQLITTWELNERSYGALEGLSKEQIATKYGEGTVNDWRRSYELRPPQLDTKDPRNPANNSQYKDVPKELLPTGESLEDTEVRIRKFWARVVLPEIAKKNNVLVISHGNSLRVFSKILENLSIESLAKLEIPTGQPILYSFDENLDLVGPPEYLKY
ncbi:MAG TPA: 2,3-bisphosphoglycerate-dependent phosphoglycerate mutase [Bdellovibrio sp.]|uniref:2,3-bisphosphoglycerate-dependent phosphoglycerate mutase n=1 Tax=Bdellovibrio sp. TaxID=28201 RepID=UPI002F134915